MEETYKKIFEERELEDFIWAAKTQKLVDFVLSEMQEYSTTQRNNLRFYVLYAMRILGSNIRKGKSEWSNESCPNDWTPTAEQIKTSAKWIQNLANQISDEAGESLDATFKGSNLLSALEKEWCTSSPFTN
ncbi:hypothetical protein [Corynebacterium glutamicum]|uniref:hypothetical protein n=1 Tax=Corynebacterium glutamicum TaxID=1718 RepID=UPI003B5BEF63